MNTRTFGNYLVGLTICAAAIAGIAYGLHKASPRGQTAEARELRSRMASGTGSYSDRAQLDEWYAQDKELPPLVKYLLIVAAGTGLVGFGLNLSSTPAANNGSNGQSASGDLTSSIAQDLKTLTDMKDNGELTQDEFEKAKTRLLA